MRRSIGLFVACVITCLLAAMSVAQSDVAVPESLQPSFGSFSSTVIDRASTRQANAVRFEYGDRSTATGGGTINLGRELSRATRERCGACSDPCRRVVLSFQSARGFGDYSGQICMQADASWRFTQLSESNWTAIAPPEPEVRVVEVPVETPVQRPETEPDIPPELRVLTSQQMLSRMTSDLASLGYVEDGANATQSSFDAFVADFGLLVSLEGNRNTQNRLMDRVSELADTVDALRGTAVPDEPCNRARQIARRDAQSYAVCLTTRAD